MKKISFFLTMLVAAVLLASCSKPQGANLVPDDAMFVMRFDPAQASSKSGLKDNSSELKKWIQDMTAEAGLSKAMREKLLDIIDDPTKTGIDLTEPLYCYARMTKMTDVEFGLVGDMASESNLTDLLNAIADETDQDEVEKTKNGSYCMQLGGDVAFIYNDKWFFLGQAKNADKMDARLQDRAGGKGSLQGNKAFEAMCEKDGVMQFLILYAGMANIPDFAQMEDFLPEGLKMEDLAVVADLALNPGETTLTSEAVCLSDNWEQYMEKGKDMLKPIGSDQTKYISDQGFSLFCNLDTKDLFEYAQNALKYFDADDEDRNLVKTIVDALDGQVSFDFHGISDGEAQMALYVGTRNSDPLNILIAQMIGAETDEDGNFVQNEEFVTVGDNEYQIPTAYDYDWTDDDFIRTVKQWGLLGYRDGLSYFATDKDAAFAVPEKPYPAGLIKGSGFFARFNFDFLNTVSGDDDEDPYSAVFSAVGDAFDCAEMYYTDDMKFILRLVNTDKQKNAVEVITDLVKHFAEED
ncbi:MAG: DUF4836 family protein [Prevotella sp.]|nr:DUF4836 family protein [Prevotella sp.]